MVSPACRVVPKTLPDHHSPEPRPTTVPLARTTNISFLLARRGWTARLLEIPASMFAGAERDSDGVINLSGDHDKRRPLGNIKRIARPDFHIRLRAFPLFNLRAHMNQHSAVGLKLFQFGQQLLAFTLLGGGAGREEEDEDEEDPAEPGAPAFCAWICVNHLFAAFGCGLANLGAIQNCGVRIGFIGESTCAFQDGAEMFAALNAIAAGMHDFTTHRDRAADIIPAADLADSKNIARASAEHRYRLRRPGRVQ